MKRLATPHFQGLPERRSWLVKQTPRARFLAGMCDKRPPQKAEMAQPGEVVPVAQEYSGCAIRGTNDHESRVVPSLHKRLQRWSTWLTIQNCTVWVK